MKDIFYAIGDFFEIIFNGVEALGNSINYIYIGIISLFLVSILALLVNTKFSYIIFLSLILFFMNNLKLLIYIKKNLNFISMIKSYFVQLAITLVNTIGIMIAILLVYLIGYRGYKY